MPSRPFIEITAANVGKHLLTAFGRQWLVSEFMGRVLPGDVGKRVYLFGDTRDMGAYLQVENDEQRARRVAKGPDPAPTVTVDGRVSQKHYDVERTVKTVSVDVDVRYKLASDNERRAAEQFITDVLSFCHAFNENMKAGRYR